MPASDNQIPKNTKTLVPLATPTPQALTIAGSDSGGGAGIGADLKTFFAQGVFGCSVITAVTAQNTQGIRHIHPIPTDAIKAQINAVADDFDIGAYKIGMLGDAPTIQAVAEALLGKDFGLCVLDPVMRAKDGVPLLTSNALACLVEHLLPLVDIITPNIPEAKALTGIDIKDETDIHKAADMLLDKGVGTVIIKGGHLADSKSPLCTDWVFTADTAPYAVSAVRTNTCHTHGTGCTFSACLTACFAKGASLSEAVNNAKAYITQAINTPINVGHGRGPLNHWVRTF